MSDDYIPETRKLVREFRGFVAVNDVSLRDRPAQIARRDIVCVLLAGWRAGRASAAHRTSA